ncbi:hypothetical protein ABXT64_10315 [Candidatus Marifrigoribacter sp. Uisw_064]|jgi:hypothetical protein|uniref:hypothetical protein n=1 Tax=Candidatus Marifrigoribacter sp. Uisw_064 TaxID=3230970 RepID=UPI003AE74487
MRTLEPTWKLSKKLILENFAFLQSEFDFPKFKKKWFRDEYYITTKKNEIEFSCLIFQISWNSPEIAIINHSEPIEFKAEIPTNYYRIDKLDESDQLKKIAENGIEYIEEYVKKCAELLKENPNILNGITSDFKTE